VRFDPTQPIRRLTTRGDTDARWTSSHTSWLLRSLTEAQHLPSLIISARGLTVPALDSGRDIRRCFAALRPALAMCRRTGTRWKPCSADQLSCPSVNIAAAAALAARANSRTKPPLPWCAGYTSAGRPQSPSTLPALTRNSLMSLIIPTYRNSSASAPTACTRRATGPTTSNGRRVTRRR
jgi:hypothetical protein